MQPRRAAALIAVIVGLLALAGQLSECAAVGRGANMEAGKLNPGDKLLYTLKSEIYDTSVQYLEVGVAGQQVLISYLNATEYGSHPDASARILKGGPGTAGVQIRCIPGPSRGLNYTIDIFGFELD